jgi:hypothetical protein
MNFHLTDGTGTADVVIWDEDDVPAIFDDDGSTGVDSLLIRNAKPESAYTGDDDIQLVVNQSTTVTADPDGYPQSTDIDQDRVSTNPDDADQDGVSTSPDGTQDGPDDLGQSGKGLTASPDADVQAVADIDPNDAVVASVAGDIQLHKNDGFAGESSDGPCMNFHLDDGTGFADIVVWDEDDLPAIFDADGTIGVDSLMIRNAKPESAYLDDDDVQLVINQSTTVTADPGENQTLASTDGGQSGAETLNEQLDDAIIQEATKRQDDHGADVDAVAAAVSDRVDASDDDVLSRIDDLLSAGRGIYSQLDGKIKPK